MRHEQQEPKRRPTRPRGPAGVTSIGSTAPGRLALARRRCGVSEIRPVGPVAFVFLLRWGKGCRRRGRSRKRRASAFSEYVGSIAGLAAPSSTQRIPETALLSQFLCLGIRSRRPVHQPLPPALLEHISGNSSHGHQPGAKHTAKNKGGGNALVLSHVICVMAWAYPDLCLSMTFPGLGLKACSASPRHTMVFVHRHLQASLVS